MTSTAVSAVFDNCIINAFGGLITWPTLAAASSKAWCALLTQTGQAAVNKATWASYGGGIGTGISNEVANGSGYTTGGYRTGTTAVALSGASPNVAVFGPAAPANNISTWTGATFTPYTALFHYGTTQTGSSNPLCSYHDITNAGANVPAVSNGTLTLTWSTNGIYTITISAAA
jgi:hypothetical protein